MNWREKIRGFGGIGSFEYEGKKVQPLNNNNNNLPRDYLRDFTLYSQNSQNTQNPQKEIPEVASPQKKKITPAQNIPAPNPPGLGPEYDALWKKAWRLADFIDDPAAAPLAARKARLPELLMMRDRMAKIEQQGCADSTPTEDRTPDYCPAKCKRTGKCYGATWFTGKAGKASVCVSVCPWAEQLLKQHFIDKKEISL